MAGENMAGNICVVGWKPVRGLSRALKCLHLCGESEWGPPLINGT